MYFCRLFYAWQLFKFDHGAVFRTIHLNNKTYVAIPELPHLRSATRTAMDKCSFIEFWCATSHNTSLIKRTHSLVLLLACATIANCVFFYSVNMKRCSSILNYKLIA